MLERFSIAEARNQFTALLRRVEERAPIGITRRGKTVAVIVSLADYQRLQGEGRGFWDAYQAFLAEGRLQGGRLAG